LIVACAFWERAVVKKKHLTDSFLWSPQPTPPPPPPFLYFNFKSCYLVNKNENYQIRDEINIIIFYA